jgi:hypothetical protein
LGQWWWKHRGASGAKVFWFFFKKERLAFFEHCSSQICLVVPPSVNLQLSRYVPFWVKFLLCQNQLTDSLGIWNGLVYCIAAKSNPILIRFFMRDLHHKAWFIGRSGTMSGL